MSVRRRVSLLRPTTTVSQAAKLADATPLRMLFEYGAEMDPMALFDAIESRRHGADIGTATMVALLEHGADVNSLTKKGTPLIYAVTRNKIEKLSLLLAHGADPSLTSHGGTALDEARTLGRAHMIEILERAQVNEVP